MKNERRRMYMKRFKIEFLMKLSNSIHCALWKAVKSTITPIAQTCVRSCDKRSYISRQYFADTNRSTGAACVARPKNIRKMGVEKMRHFFFIQHTAMGPYRDDRQMVACLKMYCCLSQQGTQAITAETTATAHSYTAPFS